jgi:hypothetical protein
MKPPQNSWKWRNLDQQLRYRRCLHLGSGKGALNGRHAARSRRSSIGNEGLLRLTGVKFDSAQNEFPQRVANRNSNE